MGGMLVYDIEAVMELNKPVRIEYLANELIFRLYLALQQLFVEKIQLFRLDGGFLLLRRFRIFTINCPLF